MACNSVCVSTCGSAGACAALFIEGGNCNYVDGCFETPTLTLHTYTHIHAVYLRENVGACTVKTPAPGIMRLYVVPLQLAEYSMCGVQ